MQLQQTFVVRFYKAEGGRKAYGPTLGPFRQVTVHLDMLWADDAAVAEVIFAEWKLRAPLPHEGGVFAGFDVIGVTLPVPSVN